MTATVSIYIYTRLRATQTDRLPDRTAERSYPFSLSTASFLGRTGLVTASFLGLTMKKKYIKCNYFKKCLFIYKVLHTTND